MNVINTYACYGTDVNERLGSSSGGIFSIIARKIFNDNGIVYGVAMAEDCYSAEFISVTDERELYRLRGSKYLQARMGDTFNKVRDNLNSGIQVLFSGTGCQINGLKSFLGREYDNLLCIDVICHGTPSPGLWKEYVKYQEQKNSGKLKYVNFRCKDKSWIDFGMKEVLESIPQKDIQKLYISKDIDSYMQMFLRNYSLRPSCYHCVAKTNKMSDLTIADFWGINEIAPEMNDGNGTSLVITRTTKGQKVIDSIRDEILIRKVSYKEGVKANPAEYESVSCPSQRADFFHDMHSMSFEELEKKYASPIAFSFPFRIKRKLKIILKFLHCAY